MNLRSVSTEKYKIVVFRNRGDLKSCGLELKKLKWLIMTLLWGNLNDR